MFSVHNPGKMFSEHVLGTRAFILRALCKCSRYPFVQVENGVHLSLRSIDVLCIHCATCEVILMSTLRADSGLRAKPRPLSTLVLGTTSVHTCFGCVLRGQFVPRTWV